MKGRIMKRYALAAFGPERAWVRALFTALHENGCAVDSCLLTSVGPGFAAALLVEGKKTAVSAAVRSLEGRLLVKAAPVDEKEHPIRPNLQITAYGPSRPETIRLLSELIDSVNGEITDIESKTIGSASIFSIQARCPGSLSSIRARMNALSKKLSLKHSVERIRPEDLA